MNTINTQIPFTSRSPMTMPVQVSPQMQPMQMLPPVPMQPVQQIQYIPLIPIPQPQMPALTVLPNTLPITTPFKFWDSCTNTVVDYIPPQLLQQRNNQWVAPVGYSFVSMPMEQQIPQTASVDSGVSDLQASQPPVSAPVSRENSPEPDRKRKYRHRSKQERIEQMHAILKQEFTQKGLFASDDEVLRGFDTVRVHVKTYRGLNVIQQPLGDIENDDRVQILKIATPFSMKNKFQKKGFIVYLKLARESQVEIVQSIFQRYEEYFPKCDLALKKEDKLRMEAGLPRQSSTLQPLLCQQKFEETGKNFDDWNNQDAWGFDVDVDLCAPPSMLKRGSLSG